MKFLKAVSFFFVLSSRTLKLKAKNPIVLHSKNDSFSPKSVQINFIENNLMLYVFLNYKPHLKIF